MVHGYYNNNNKYINKQIICMLWNLSNNNLVHINIINDDDHKERNRTIMEFIIDHIDYYNSEAAVHILRNVYEICTDKEMMCIIKIIKNEQIRSIKYIYLKCKENNLTNKIMLLNDVYHLEKL